MMQEWSSRGGIILVFLDVNWKNALTVNQPAGSLVPESDYPLTVERENRC